MLTLVVEAGGRREQFAFAGEEITIGRHEDNDLRIGSRYVSQHHCKLQKLAKGWKVVDMKSQNGTRVNGAEVTQKMLKIGDRLEVGHVPIFFVEAPEEVTEELNPATDEATPAQGDDIVISARTDGGPRGALADELSRVFLEYRKNFGDERGLLEIERAVESVTGRLFPRPAFATPADAAKLMDVVKAINSELNLRRCLALIVDSVISITGAERGFLILIDERAKMKVKVARNFDAEAVTKADLKFSHSIAEDVGKSGKSVISTSAQEDRRFETAQSVAAMKLRSVMCLPFRVRERVIGVLYLDHRFRKAVFTQRHLDFVESFADQAAIAIENARLYEDNQKAQEEIDRRKSEVEDLESMLNARIKEQQIEVADIRSYAPKRGDFKFDYSFIIGDSPKMLEIFQLLERVIPSDVPVLVTGESGTGKELIAKAIHVNSNRNKNPFVKENCAAIPETLLESELFGYKKGAFTGADRDKAGLFQEAHRGTLFLDEIGEMSLDLQKKLLRVLQEGEIRPVGAREISKIDVRLVTATNKDFKKAVAAGEFREDLFYRINVIGVEMPPLRDRLEDIPALVDHFLRYYAKKSGVEPKGVEDLAMRALVQYHWPGNVRELENEVQRACAIGGDVITSDDFSKDISAAPPEPAGKKSQPMWKDIAKMAMHQKERELILRALEENDWKKSGAARSLGMSRPTLDSKIKAYGLDPYIRRGKMKR